MCGMTAKPVRVLIVDDDPLVRAGLRLMLGGNPQIEVVGEAADGADGVQQALSLRPAVVLMDIRMPRMDGITAIARICGPDGAPDTRVIALTTFSADDDVVKALSAGASGYLLKDTPPATIVEAVGRVAAGEPMLSPSVTEGLIRRVAGGEVSPRDARTEAARQALASLTERERDVAVAVGRGLANQEIADELFMSVATVKAYVSRLLAKLEADNRVQIAIIVHDAGDLPG